MAFDNPDWLFEIKWTATAPWPHRGRHVRLVSRTQNDLTASLSSLALPQFVKAQRAILDGEIVALDDKGFFISLMQQRTDSSRESAACHGWAICRPSASVVYYAFDLLYLDGFDLRRYPGAAQAVLQERIVAATLRTFRPLLRERFDLFEAASSANWKGLSPRNAAAFMKRSVRAIG